MVFPCTHCVRLHKKCVKSDNSVQCSECVRADGRKCVELKPSYTEAEWNRLIQAQEKLREEEEIAMAKILRLRKQQRLLQKRAGDFIVRDIKEIEELEKLEEQEQRERVDASQSSCGAGGSSSSPGVVSGSTEIPSLDPMSPSFDCLSFDALVASGIVESSAGNLSSSQ